MKKMQNVTIKGTKDGLTLHLNDECSYDDIKIELEQKLSTGFQTSDSPGLLSVKLETGFRHLTGEQQEEIKSLIRKNKNLTVEEINSKVITVEEAEKQRKENGITTIAKIVRSGQVIEVPGDLLLIGDVNPGGTVKAVGNIFILGALKGIAHAGCKGNGEAVIAASNMLPSQLRISDCLKTVADQVNKEEKHEMECGYIDSNQQIVIDRLQGLMHLRPNLTRLEGGR